MDFIFAVVCRLILAFKLVEHFVYGFFPITVIKAVKKVFRKADVEIDGHRNWDIRVHNDQFYRRLTVYASLGFGESYMDRWWDCNDVEELAYRIFRKKVFRYMLKPHNRLCTFLLNDLFNLQTPTLCWEVGRKHYDLGNELFTSFLDSSMNYSCGYWRNAKNLDEAQIHKMELIAQKLKLKPGMRVLDIGCGWGSLCKYLAEKHGVSVVGCTISVEQAKYAKILCEDLPVEIRLVDYRDINEKFDRIVSVGMFEHVGKYNYRTFFETCQGCLTDDGLLLLHTIGINHAKIPLSEPWTQKYIFVNGILPYYKHITEYSEGLFILEDWQSFGYNYHLTLKAWYVNFLKSWPKLQAKYDETFYRMWCFYLQFAAGAFRARFFNVWQVVFSKDGFEGGYEAVR